MPYIEQELRPELERRAQGLGRKAQTPGELNFAIIKVLLGYLDRTGKSYAVLNELVGVLECVKLIFHDQIILPYEEKKREENGDVY